LTSAYIASSAASPHRHLDALYSPFSVRHSLELVRMIGSKRIFVRCWGQSRCSSIPWTQRAWTVCLSWMRARRGRRFSSSLDCYRTNAGDGPIRLIHPSVHDFLIDDVRCSDVNFVVDARAQHTLLASGVCECCRACPGYVQDRRPVGAQSTG